MSVCLLFVASGRIAEAYIRSPKDLCAVCNVILMLRGEYLRTRFDFFAVLSYLLLSSVLRHDSDRCRGQV